MPRVLLDEIPVERRLTPARVHELTGWSRSGVFARIADGTLTWAFAPNTGHGPKLVKVVDALSLQPEGLKRWQESQLQGAFLAPLPAHSQALAVSDDPRQMRLLAISLSTVEQENDVGQFLAAYGIAGNGAAPTFGLTTVEFKEKVAGQHGLKLKTFYRKARAYRLKGIQGITKRNPGPKPIGPGLVFRKPENAWMAAWVLENHRRGIPMARNLRSLHKEIDTKQPFHPEHKYERPTYHELKVFLGSQPPIEEVAREGGVPALRTAAGYCDRLIDEASGDTWCIDEWMVDGRVYMDRDTPKVIRPFIITIIDQRSEAILGWKLTANLNPEIVLDLCEEVMRKCWKPLRFYSDKGGHFRAKVGKHFRDIPNEKLIGHATGVLGRFGILHQGPGKEKNPRANCIERSVHGYYAAKALEALAGSACGNSKDSPRAAECQTRVDRHLQLCKSGNVRLTELLSYGQLKAMLPAWIAEYNGTFSKANGVHGLTHEAAFRTFSPPEEVRQSRAVDETEMAVKFAERFEDRMIREGGVIDLGEREGERFRYYSPILTLHKGTRALVSRFRHTRSFVVVEFNDGVRDVKVMADRRTLVGIGDKEGIAAAQEERNRVAKYLEATYAPVAQVCQLPPITPEDDIKEIGSPEFIMRGGRRAAMIPAPVTSFEIASSAVEMELRNSPPEVEPSLYDLNECTMEER